MSWNYRVVKQTHGVGVNEEVLFQIHEVYYDDDSGDIINLTVDPIRLTGESMATLRQAIDWIQEGLDKPVLDYGTLEKLWKTPHNT